MSEKTFIIIFIVITIIAVAGLAVSKVLDNGNASLAGVSPSPSGLVFNLGSSPSNAPASTQPPQIKQYQGFPTLSPGELQNKKIVIQTQKGTIEFSIDPEATKAASSFIFLSEQRFFDGLTFHRVEDWVIQGGDPTGTGRGGPGYQFADEPVTRPYLKGTVAMANAGPNTNGSQFFILKTDYPLSPNYTIFGQVISGQDVVEKIAVGDVMQKVTVEPLK